MLGNAHDMPIVADIVGPPEGIPINSTDVEMEEGNLFVNLRHVLIIYSLVFNPKISFIDFFHNFYNF